MSIFVKRYKARTDVAVKRGRCGGRWPVVGLVFSRARLSHEASGSFVMDQIAAIAAQLAATAGTAAADPAVQHFATMLVAGLGVGGVAVGLNLAFPASKPGPDYSKVLERGVFSEEEFAGACCAVVMMLDPGNSCVTHCCAVVLLCRTALKEKKEEEQAAAFKSFRASMLGKDFDAKQSEGDDAASGALQDDTAPQAAAGASSSGLRRRAGRARGDASDDSKTGGDGEADTVPAAAEKASETAKDDDDGSTTDEEDMNPDMTEEQRNMQKSLLGTRNVRKIAKMLDDAEAKARAGEEHVPTHKKVSRSLDLIVCVQRVCAALCVSRSHAVHRFLLPQISGVVQLACVRAPR